MDICGAKTRAGHPCRCPILFPNGRCRVHGGPTQHWKRHRRRRTNKKPVSYRVHPKRSNRSWNWVAPRLIDPRGRPVAPDEVGSIRMLNAGLSANTDGYCVVTDLPVFKGGGCPRAFWVCTCGKRCAIVYLDPLARRGFGPAFRCMECAGYRYASAWMSGSGRTKAMRRQLDQLTKLAYVVRSGERPRGMRRRTWERLKAVALARHQDALHMLGVKDEDDFLDRLDFKAAFRAALDDQASIEYMAHLVAGATLQGNWID